MQPAQQIPHLPAGYGVHSRCGLIQQKDLRLCHQGTTDHQLALHPSGKMPHRPMLKVCQAGEGKELLGFLPDLLAGKIIQPALIFHGLTHGHILAHGIFLCNHTKPALFPGCLPGQRDSVHQDPSLAGQQHRGHHTDGGGLAGTVLA